MKTAVEYWDAAAETYAQDFADTLIGRTRRKAVWREADRVFRPGQRVLELNCGTGLDAVHLAERGIQVLACDISSRMIELARERAKPFSSSVEFRVLPNEEIGALVGEGPFDGAFSNFSGLNCVEDLSAVAHDLHRCLRNRAPLLITMMGRFVPWEMVWFLAQARPRKAFRRFRWHTLQHARDGALKIHCPSVQEIVTIFAPYFKLSRWRGIGILVPPSYMEGWARRVPALIKAFAEIDRGLSTLPGVRTLADCMLFEFVRNGVE